MAQFPKQRPSVSPEAKHIVRNILPHRPYAIRYCERQPLEHFLNNKTWETCGCDLCDLAKQIHEEKWAMSEDVLNILKSVWGVSLKTQWAKEPNKSST